LRVGLQLAVDDDVPTQARQAERLGFDQLACGEHLFFHSPHPNAFVLLAAAAGATERIRLLTALTILPVYPAVLAAKLAATLDVVSAGRLDLGIGIGGEYPPEFEAAGVPVAERGARTTEALEVLTRLFAGERLEFDGYFTRVPGLALDPLPVQRPAPPVWMGGRKPAAMRRAARFSDVWLPYMFTPEQLAKSLREVRETAERAGRDPEQIRGAIFCWGAVGEESGWARQLAIDTVSRTYDQDFTPLADRYLLSGTPDQVRARLREYSDAGAQTLVFAPAGTGQDRNHVVELFAEQVLGDVQSWVR
jgi:probable F420-dependent oxidoreductase